MARVKWHDRLIDDAPDQKVAEIVLRALDRLIDKDKCLLTLNAHERSIAHRLAVHLEDVLFVVARTAHCSLSRSIIAAC